MDEYADRYPYSPASRLPGADWHAETIGAMPDSDHHNGVSILGDPGVRPFEDPAWTGR